MLSRSFNCAEPETRASGLRDATASIRRGELVVLPTDTVYGVAADAFNASAVRSIYAVRACAPDVPMPVLVGSPSALHGLAAGMPHAAWELVDSFWPGPLTIIVRAQPTLTWDLGDSRGTVMIRMPLHPVAIELLRETGPLAATSATRVTDISPTTSVIQAHERLGDAVSVYLDGGEISSRGLSTIVDLTGEVPRLVRRGSLMEEDIRSVAPNLVAV